MDRRRYLTLAGATSAAAVAGCLDSDDSSDDSDSGGDGEDQIPGWTEWVPASVVTTDRSVSVVETDTLRTEFPENVYNQFQVSTLSDTFGFDPSAMETVVSVGGQTGTALEVLIGSFDADEVLTAIGVDGDSTSEYGGFQMFDEGGLAIGDSAIIFGEREAAIDTKNGDETAFGRDSDNWSRMLRETAGSTVITADETPLVMTQDPSFDVEIIATTFDPADGDQIQAGGYYLFDSESTASDVLDTRRDALESHFSGQSDVEINEVEQRDAMLVIDGETNASSF